MKKSLPFALGFILLMLPLVWLVFTSKPFAKKQLQPLPIADSTYTLSLLFVGDVMQHQPQIDAVYNPTTKTYDYTPNFRYIKNLTQGYDVAIANLETTLPGKAYTGYPMFGSPDALVAGLKDAGFDILAKSNNHSNDKGLFGVLRSIDVIQNMGLQQVGTYADSIDALANHPLLFRVNNITVALLNYTYGTNGLPTKKPSVVNLIDSLAIINDIAKAKRFGADFVIPFFHWGNEYQRQPSPDQRRVAMLCFNHGADLIIGAHPHVVQPVEELTYTYQGQQRKGVVFWSLGNYISNQRTRYQDGGIMAHIDLTKSTKDNTTKLSNYAYIPFWVNKTLTNGKTDYYVLPVSAYEADSTQYPLTPTERVLLKTSAKDARTLLTPTPELKHPFGIKSARPLTTTGYTIAIAYTNAAQLTTITNAKDSLAARCACQPTFSKTATTAYYLLPTPNATKAQLAARYLQLKSLTTQVRVEYR